jgi:hypothetical protein
MKFGDYSPPSSPSLDQQRQALQKGLGRAMQWALNGRLNDELLMEACLVDHRFDTQVDDSRGNWLWRIIRAGGATDRFRVPILHALYELSDDRNGTQLCELARCYARSGDETFRTRLYEIFEQKPFSTMPWLAEEELVDLDGEKAFLFAARVRGRGLATRDWDWDDDHFVENAIKRWGERQVKELLDNSADKAINTFREIWHQEKRKKAERKPALSHKERVRAITVNEILCAAESDDTRFVGLFRGWGMHADPTDLGTVLQHLWAAQQPKVVTNLLRVFSNRALPQFDARLIELCQHSDAKVRWRAFGALEKNAHRQIRRFALTELAKGVCDGLLVSLFINNYEQGDEQRILEAMELPPDECERHWLLMDVCKVLEKNAAADCSQLGVIVYASTPCESCRFDAIRLLHNQQFVPEWMKEECRYDSCEDCRKLVEKNIGIDGGG